MARYDITSGLPDLPPGLPDKEYNLVSPLYRALANVATKAASLGNFVQYDKAELSYVNPLAALNLDRTNRIIVKAGEALGYGVLVTLNVVSGAVVATKADNTVGTGARAQACINSPSGLALGEFGEAVYMQGICSGISGTTFGSTYYLGTAGTATTGQSIGTIQQAVGIGLGTAGMYLNIASELTVVVGIAVAGAGPKGLRVHLSDGTSYDI